MKHNFRLVTALVAAFVVSGSTLCLAADIRVFSGGAPKDALALLTPEFEKLSGHKVHFSYLVISEIGQKLTAGEKPDMLIVPVTNLDALIKAGTLMPEPRALRGDRDGCASRGGVSRYLNARQAPKDTP